MQNYYLQQKLAEGHRQELFREAAQRRMVEHASEQPFSLIQRSLGKLGQYFLMFGMRFKELKSNSEHAMQQL
jgi:hypothetical protein